MAPQKQQKPPGDEEPVQEQIVVAPEEITERPSQQQFTGNSHDRPALLQVAKSTIKPLGEDQLELQKSDDCVFATGHGINECLPPSDKQTPSKTAGPANATRKWCRDCIRLKTLPGENGRSRRNAKHGCLKCAELRGEAGPRGKRQAGHSSTPNGQGNPPATQAQPEPGNSRPTPKKPLPLSSIWQRQNPGETAQSVHRKEWKLAVPSKKRQEHIRGFDPGTESDDSDNPPKPNIDNPLVDIFGRPKAHSESVFVPSPSSGGPSDLNAIQGNASFPPSFTYPDPVEFSSISSHFDDATGIVDLSNDFENLSQMYSESTGGPSSGNMAPVNAWVSNTSDASSPAPFDFSGMTGSANPTPTDPPVSQRHPGLRPLSIDPMLSGAPHQSRASPGPASSVPSATVNNQHNESPGTEGGEDMFDQYIN
ncbi:hypothetical protein LA080_006844 [Diaporthe eres]|uniref:GATA-type domain-containing protein n=1 Tax=Diaporthe vaccinii TaxID=105482 RepID=A0ABR4EX34_9PEZI|nr:hypothetical protein LA080_006844 [Diaporthe eres]